MKTNVSNIHLKDSIAARLLKVAFSIYVVISFSLTALHMFTEYRSTKKEVRQELEALYQIILVGLTNAFYDADLFQVQDIIEGMATSPSILGCTLVDNMGQIVGQSGRISESEPSPLDQGASKEFRYHEDEATGLFSYIFPIVHVYETQEIRMGSLYLYSGNAVIFQKVKYGFFIIIANAIIKTIVLWIIFLYFSRLMLGRPLSILTAATQQLSMESLEDFHVDVGTRGQNELKILEEAFNSMVRKLHGAHIELKNYAHELDRSRRQLDDIVDNSPAVICVKDTSGRYMIVNREFERLFHMTRDRILGKTDRELFPEKTAGILITCDRKALTADRPVETEENISLDDGVYTYLSIKFPLHDAQKNIYGVCGIATDISERIKAEKILKDFNEYLKQEVAQRTRELQQANLNLEQKQAMLERLAALDGLTEIPNRRQFDIVLDKEWRRAERSATALALIMIDIDYFKNFNDHYGHAAGDECLKKIAQTLADSLGRASDFLARYGGEEFAVILPDASAESATGIAEKMKEKIESLNIPHAVSQVADHVTLSLGIALCIPSKDTFPRRLIETADNAMYQAKANGRNQFKYAKGMRG